jgi:long-subunit fatty acid transport protein
MKNKLATAVCLALCGVSGSAFALTDSDVNAVIPFNFANPGARSLGMGGAFLALSDDATAAYTNPAGLTQLGEAEVSIEGRHSSFSVPYVAGGSFSVDPLDTSGLNAANADSSTNNLSYISVSFPHDRWSFAFYRNEILRYDNAFGGDSFVAETVELPGLGTDVIFPIAGRQSLKIVDWGFSVALRVNDAVSLGAGLSYYRFNIDANVGRFTDSTFFSQGGILLNTQEQFGSDTDVGVNLGARFTPSEHWSFALAYRRGPEFNYDARSTLLRNAFDDPPSELDPPFTLDVNDVKFKVPDVFSLGLSWQPTDAWRINFDINRVMYSQVTDDLRSLFAFEPATLDRLAIPDGTEYHLGAEYTFAQMANPVSLRAGIWHDPRHSLAYRGNPIDDPGFRPDEGLIGPTALAAVYGVSKGSQTHYALGAGIAFKQFQLDFGADFSDLIDTYSVSAVWRF